MSSRKEQKMQLRTDRIAREAKLRADAERRRRVRRVSAFVAGLAVIGVAGIAIASASHRPRRQSSSPPVLRLTPLATIGRLQSPGAPGPLGPEGVPIPAAPDLAGPASREGAGPVDGIRCLGTEQLLFHIHAHLTLYVHGMARRIPAGIGITGAQRLQTPEGQYVGGGSCFYWLHTHAADGIIHIESLIQRIFTLGQFFDVWAQKLAPGQIGPIEGPVTAIYNGSVYTANPRDIPLTAHAQIQLEVGRPRVSPVAITFPPGL